MVSREEIIRKNPLVEVLFQGQNTFMGDDSSIIRPSTRPSPRYQPLVIALAAASAGIVIDRLWEIPLFALWGSASIAWIAWLLLWRGGRVRTASLALMLSAGAAAASWHHCHWYLYSADDLGYFASDDNQPVCVEAVALKMPRTRPASETFELGALTSREMTRLEIVPVTIRDGTHWRSISGRTRLTIPNAFSGVLPGDRLRIFAQLSSPASARNPGEFDFAEYLRGRRTCSELLVKAAECISVVESGSAWSPTRLLEQLRMHGNKIFAATLDQRRAEMADAVLLGLREQVDAERTEAFMETGTIHVLVIAGLHLGMLAGALMFVMLRSPLPRVWAAPVVAAFTLCYMLMVDAQPPVVRAAIVVLVACAALCLGRRPLGFNSLAAAALVVLAVNPTDLFHTGAQLSFLCTAGIIWTSPWLTGRPRYTDPLARLIAESRGGLTRAARRIGRRLLSLMLLSLVLWLASMPLVMARFHLFTPISVLVNTVIWAPLGASLLSAFATLLLGTISPLLGHLSGSVCNASFWLLETMIQTARGAPGSHFWLPGPPDWWMAVFYGALAVSVAFPRFRPRRRWCLAIVAGWTAVGLGSAMLRHSPGRLDCTLLALDHGCAVVVELPSGQTVLYDAGRLGSPNAATRSISATLWSQGITHLDAIVLSHGDTDHYNAVPELLERFSVGVVYVSPVMFENENSSLLALRDAIRRGNVPLREIRAGDRLPGGKGCRIEVLHPPPRGVLDNENANSVVLAVEYLGHRILLPGDLEGTGMNALLAEEPLPCDVLLAPHHGSRQSNPPGLAQWSTPQWVVISGSRRFDPRPIQAAYEAVGAQVMQTTKLGAIRVRIEATGMNIIGQRSETD
jgi:competence protein ComEC